MKIAIASGKGGTGKTTLSTNLASFIAESRECVLSDLDVEDPNSGLFIKAELIHIWFKRPRSYALVKAISSLITFILSIIMISWTYPYFVWGLTKGETSQALLIPMVLSQSAIFAGAILMSLYFLTELIDYTLQSLGKNTIFEQLSKKGN